MNAASAIVRSSTMQALGDYVSLLKLRIVLLLDATAIAVDRSSA